MGKCLKLCVLALACAMAFGCASKNHQREDTSMRAEQRFRRSYEAAFNNNEQQDNQQLLRKARSAIGTPYVRGGMSPGGFDCSGFVCWAYKSVGVSLPRTAREQSVVGKRITNVEDMRVGDIVAFRHPRRGYHTGIYVGDGKFIHSPHRRTTVRINSLSDPYFKGTFLGARRVKMDGTENLVAEAETRLNDYAEEKAVRDIYRSHKASSRNSVASRDDHRKSSKDKKRSKGKNSSKSRDKYVEVASLDKKHRSTRKIEADKADRPSAKSSGKSSAKENKSDKKSSSSASKSGSSKVQSEKSGHKSENRKSDSPKTEQRKTESRKPEAAKSGSKSGAAKTSASRGESSKKGKGDASKAAPSKSDNGKSKKNPAKHRDNNS